MERESRILKRLTKRGLAEYAHAAARTHHVTMEEMLGEQRYRPFVSARHALWRALHDEANLSWPIIAKMFEKKHDSIFHSSSHRESRSRATLERGVVTKIADYVRGLGYEELARKIEVGQWRHPTTITDEPKDPTIG